MARNHTRAVRPRAIPVEEIEAFHHFFELRQRGVFSLLVHLGLDESQAGELTQEVFVSVWNEWRGLRDEDERVVACYRNALVRGRAAAAGPRTSIAADDGPVAQALRNLPEEERVVIVLCYVANLHPGQAARALQGSERWVRSVLCRAWKHVAAVLAARGECGS